MFPGGNHATNFRLKRSRNRKTMKEKEEVGRYVEDGAQQPYNGVESISIAPGRAILVASNQLSGSNHESAVCAVTDFDNLTYRNAHYRLFHDVLVSNVKYIRDNLFVVTYSSGAVDLCLLPHANSQPYEEFGNKLSNSRLPHSIKSAEILKNEVPKVVVGDNHGNLRVLGISRRGLLTWRTIHDAHEHSITGIAGSNEDLCIFITCSLDKSLKLWDLRDKGPDMIFRNEKFCCLRDCCWSGYERGPQKLLVADRMGWIHFLDKRQPNRVLCSHQFMQKPIYKIYPNGTRLAIIGESTKIKVVDLSTQNDIYIDDTETKVLRGGVWLTKTNFLAHGFSGKMKNHFIDDQYLAQPQPQI